ncbi:MAG: hypothetical protein V3U80_06415 [Flavobacteriaceae bacterium]
MNRKIRLIWEFRGPDSLGIAKHHVIHLQEFAKMENLAFYEVNTIEHSNYFNSAFIIVDEKDMLTYKNALKPDRGTVFRD